MSKSATSFCPSAPLQTPCLTQNGLDLQDELQGPWGSQDHSVLIRGRSSFQRKVLRGDSPWVIMVSIWRGFSAKFSECVTGAENPCVNSMRLVIPFLPNKVESHYPFRRWPNLPPIQIDLFHELLCSTQHCKQSVCLYFA